LRLYPIKNHAVQAEVRAMSTFYEKSQKDSPLEVYLLSKITKRVQQKNDVCLEKDIKRPGKPCHWGLPGIS
jgi:hypothetical protein